MKKFLCILLVFLLAALLSGCSAPQGGHGQDQQNTIIDTINERAKNGGNVSKSSSGSQSGKTAASNTPVDVDLTTMSSTMVYAEVNQMVSDPGKYMGKTVRMKGAFNVFEGDGKNYYACLISDATACCAQGIEFDLAEKRKYPDDYPDINSEITVSGEFTTYNEGDQRYCQLKNAVLE